VLLGDIPQLSDMSFANVTQAPEVEVDRELNDADMRDQKDIDIKYIIEHVLLDVKHSKRAHWQDQFTEFAHIYNIDFEAPAPAAPKCKNKLILESLKTKLAPPYPTTCVYNKICTNNNERLAHFFDLETHLNACSKNTLEISYHIGFYLDIMKADKQLWKEHRKEINYTDSCINFLIAFHNFTSTYRRLDITITEFRKLFRMIKNEFNNTATDYFYTYYSIVLYTKYSVNVFNHPGIIHTLDIHSGH
jgi:hypothetical protein